MPMSMQNYHTVTQASFKVQDRSQAKADEYGQWKVIQTFEGLRHKRQLNQETPSILNQAA